MSTDEQIKQIQYTQMPLKNFYKVLIELENFKNFIDDHK